MRFHDPDDWYCRLCGEDLGDFAEVASGDCIECGRVVCENCWGHYDLPADGDGQVTCVRCPRRTLVAATR